jgi:hypothetical protein
VAAFDQLAQHAVADESGAAVHEYLHDVCLTSALTSPGW